MGCFLDCVGNEEPPLHAGKEPRLRDPVLPAWKVKRTQIFMTFSHELPVPEEDDETQDEHAGRDA